MTTTVNQLARSFGVVVRQIADLLMMLQDYHALVPNLTRVLDISTTEVLELQVTFSDGCCLLMFKLGLLTIKDFFDD